MNKKIFINRRSGKDRRNEQEQRQNPRLNLSCRQRRKTADRRMPARELTDDFYASCEDLYSNTPKPEKKH